MLRKALIDRYSLESLNGSIHLKLFRARELASLVLQKLVKLILN